MSGALSHEKMGLSFTIAAGLRQRKYSRVRVPWDSWPQITVSDSRLSQPGGPGPRTYIPQEQGGPVVSPGTGFPFHRLLRLAALRWRYSNRPPHKVKVRVTLRLAVYRKSVCLGVKPHETHDQRYFPELNPCAISPYVTSSLTRRWVCLLWICLAFRQVYISHIYRHVTEKFLPLLYAQVLCQYRLCRAEHAYLTYLMLQRLISHFNGCKLDHLQV
jgi:hypothetical protein